MTSNRLPTAGSGPAGESPGSRPQRPAPRVRAICDECGTSPVSHNERFCFNCLQERYWYETTLSQSKPARCRFCPHRATQFCGACGGRVCSVHFDGGSSKTFSGSCTPCRRFNATIDHLQRGLLSFEDCLRQGLPAIIDGMSDIEDEDAPPHHAQSVDPDNDGRPVLQRQLAQRSLSSSPIGGSASILTTQRQTALRSDTSRDVAAAPERLDAYSSIPSSSTEFRGINLAKRFSTLAKKGEDARPNSVALVSENAQFTNGGAAENRAERNPHVAAQALTIVVAHGFAKLKNLVPAAVAYAEEHYAYLLWVAAVHSLLRLIDFAFPHVDTAHLDPIQTHEVVGNVISTTLALPNGSFNPILLWVARKLDEETTRHGGVVMRLPLMFVRDVCLFALLMRSEPGTGSYGDCLGSYITSGECTETQSPEFRTPALTYIDVYKSLLRTCAPLFALRAAAHSLAVARFESPPQLHQAAAHVNNVASWLFSTERAPAQIVVDFNCFAALKPLSSSLRHKLPRIPTMYEWVMRGMPFGLPWLNPEPPPTMGMALWELVRYPNWVNAHGTEVVSEWVTNYFDDTEVIM